MQVHGFTATLPTPSKPLLCCAVPCLVPRPACGCRPPCLPTHRACSRRLSNLQAPVVPSAERETFLFFRGGCGSTDPAVRPYFAAGKMLRWALVRALNSAPQPDIHVRLSWGLLGVAEDCLDCVPVNCPSAGALRHDG